jgi:hypothetical protein
MKEMKTMKPEEIKKLIEETLDEKSKENVGIAVIYYTHILDALSEEETKVFTLLTQKTHEYLEEQKALFSAFTGDTSEEEPNATFVEPEKGTVQ